MNFDNLNYYVDTILRDRYEIESVIGKGCYGGVLKAQDLLSGKPVAVKVGKVNDRSIRFESEQYRKVRGSRHLPDLVDVIEFENGSHCLILSLEKESIYDYFVRTPLISVPKIAMVMSEVLEGLRYLHQNKIVHRDLHPGNILIPLSTNKSRIILADLGSSGSLGNDEVYHGIVHLEQLVPAFCTPYFVTLGNKYIEADDVFSLIYNVFILHRSAASEASTEEFQLFKRDLYNDLDNTIPDDSRVFYEFIREVNFFRPAVDGLREIPNYNNLQSIIRRIPGFDETTVL